MAAKEAGRTKNKVGTLESEYAVGKDPNCGKSPADPSEQIHLTSENILNHVSAMI